MLNFHQRMRKKRECGKVLGVFWIPEGECFCVLILHTGRLVPCLLHVKEESHRLPDPMDAKTFQMGWDDDEDEYEFDYEYDDEEDDDLFDDTDDMDEDFDDDYDDLDEDLDDLDDEDDDVIGEEDEI
ncbi:hypothetical protein GF373_10465 [bacterium]|nr:hypothetical protein [bacterium]